MSNWQHHFTRFSAERLMPWVALLPITVWFLMTVLLTAPPAWRARYRAAEGQPVVVERFERELSHLWSGKFAPEIPGGLSDEGFVAEYDACLSLEEGRTIRLMLVTDGTARLLIDGNEQLAAQSDKERGVAGRAIDLASGLHHLRVQLRARKRPSVGLLASFENEVPAAVGSGKVGPGVRVSPPVADDDPCSH